MSGGQQQRTAIARALINNPAIILADEPTGNLDSDSTETIYELLRDINQKLGTTFIIITHDRRIAEKADRIIEIKKLQIENLKQQLKSIIHQTVTKGLDNNAELKDSGIEWIGKVPKHWKKEKIFRIAEYISSGFSKYALQSVHTWRNSQSLHFVIYIFYLSFILQR